MSTTYNFTVRATDAIGNVATAAHSITVEDPVGAAPNSYAGLTCWLDGNAGAMFQDQLANSYPAGAPGEAVVRWDSTAPLNKALILSDGIRSIIGPGGDDFYGVQDAGGKFWVRPSGNNPPATPAALSTFFSAGNKIAIVVVRIHDADSQAPQPWLNNLIFGDASAAGWCGIHCYKLNATTARILFYNATSSLEHVVTHDVPFGEVVCLTLRHTGGQLRGRVNGGAWQSIASGNTGSLASQAGAIQTLYSGVDFSADLMQLATFNQNRSDAEVYEVEKHLVARATGALI